MAERINISNILQTSIVKKVIKSLHPFDKSSDDPIKIFRQQCRAVRNGCNFDISKCFKDGKPLILEGAHIDPSQLLYRNEAREFRIFCPKEETPNQAI